MNRAPADTISSDTDFGSRRVVVGCGPLSEREKALAIGKGARLARQMLADDLIRGAAFVLQGQIRALGWGTLVTGGSGVRGPGGRGRRQER